MRASDIVRKLWVFRFCAASGTTLRYKLLIVPRIFLLSFLYRLEYTTQARGRWKFPYSAQWVTQAYENCYKRILAWPDPQAQGYLKESEAEGGWEHIEVIAILSVHAGDTYILNKRVLVLCISRV